MKRTLFFSLLALVLLLGLMGCSRKQPDTPAQPAAQPVELPIEVPAGTQTDASTGEVYHWEVLETPLPRGMDGLSVMTAVGGKTVVCASGTDGSALLTLEDGAWSELIAPDGLSRGNALCADADGGFWLLYTTAERTLALARYDASFAPERTLALQCGSDNTLYTQLLKLDGGFCLLSYDRLVRVDERGAVTAQNNCDHSDGRYFTALAEVDGCLFLLAPTAFAGGSDLDELRQLDPVTLEMQPVLLERTGLCGMGTDEAGHIVLSDSSGLFRYDPATGAEETILSWDTLDTDALDGSLAPAADGWLCTVSSDTVVQARRISGAAAARTTLTLAVVGGGDAEAAVQMAKQFNQSQTDWRLEITVYGDTPNGQSADLLRTQIVAGDSPDLFCFVSSGYDDRPLAPLRVCADLQTLGVRVAPDSLLPGLYDALTQEGGLYELPLTVQLETFLAPAELIASPGVTVEELDAVQQKAGDGWVTFESVFTPDDLFALSIPFYLGKYVDRTSNTCSFETQEFYDFLRWCKTWGGDGSTRDTDERAILQYTPIATVSALCGRSLRMQEYLGYQNGYTYAGVPNEGTCGSMMAVTVSLGVSKTCRDADGAAAFLTYCQSYDALRDIPADTARLRAAVNDQLSTGQEDAAEARYVISPEDAAQFYALLDEKPLLKNGNDTLCAILREEAAPYFAGVCNEQTAAANMQSRAQLYLMEQAG